MKNDKYWSGRSARRMYEYQAQADDVADSVSKAYISSTRRINDEMESIFRTFQSDGLLSEAEAKRLLGELPEDAELNRLKSIINTIDDPDKRRKLLAVINSPAYAYRIKRFEQLQKNIDEETTKLADFEQKQSKTHYTELAGEAYNRTMFDVQKGTGLSFSFAGMPKSRVEEVLKQNWSGKLFSERIWDRAKNINKAVKEELLTQFMTGRSYRKTAKEIERRMASGAIEARRLVRTESTYIANSAELEVYKECGVKQLKFLATLDLRTSDICAAMDGKIIKLEDASPGVNVPPLHPWCRSTTVAVIDGAVTDELKRRAKDPKTGEYYEVPQDMTYEEWCKNLDKSAKSGIIKAEPVSKYLNSSEQLFKNASNVKPISDYEDMVIHGDKFGFEIRDKDEKPIDTYTPREFAKILREDPNYHGGNIRLISCEAGAEDMGAAQMLANQLGVRVMAPTDIVWIMPDGEMIVGPTEFENTGKWKIFKPKGV